MQLTGTAAPFASQKSNKMSSSSSASGSGFSTSDAETKYKKPEFDLRIHSHADNIKNVLPQYNVNSFLPQENRCNSYFNAQANQPVVGNHFTSSFCCGADETLGRDPNSSVNLKSIKNEREIPIFDRREILKELRNRQNNLNYVNLFSAQKRTESGKDYAQYNAQNTNSRITPFFLPPQQSAFSGWYMNIKELGCVISTFRYAPRAGGEPFSKSGIDIKNVFDCKSFTQDLKVKSYLIKPSKITKSDLNIMIAGKSEMIGFNTLKGFFNKINKTVKSNNRKKYVYGYWHMFDKMAHKKGVGSREIKKHFLELSKEVSRLAKRLKGTNTKLIISADHGFVDCPKSKFIDLKDHPKMGECLTLPLCGDSRVKYCYVKPDKVKQFEKYVKTKLKKCCDCYTNKEIIEKGFYGLFKPNKKLYDSTGDYILIMKDKYTLKDYILGEEKMFKIGKHSGVSEDEMLVPLVVVDC